MIVLLIILIVILNAYSTIVLAKDLRAHWPGLLKEPGRLAIQIPFMFLMYFFAAFGVSDFTLSTATHLKVGWVQPRKLPGTLNTQCALPAVLFGISYLLSVQVDMLMLLPCISTFVLGAYFSPLLAVRLPEQRIRQIIAIGLLFAGVFMLASKLNLLHMGNYETGVHGFKLVFAIFAMFIIGAFKAMGIGSYALIMTMVYFLGLSPLVSYPLMMGCGAISAPFTMVRYVRLDAYMRKLTLLAATIGVAGGALAIFVVKKLDVSVLQWLVMAVIFYAAIDMLLRLRREKAAQGAS